MAESKIPERVLITRFSAIGDVAMSIPVVYSVARSNPGTRFVYATRPSMTGIFVNPPENLEVIGVDLKREYHGARGLNRLFGELREKYRFDAYADLHSVLRTFWLGFRARLAGLRVASLYKDRSGRRKLTRRRNKIMLPLVSQRARYREVFHRLGLTVQEHFTSLFPGGRGPASDFAEVSQPKADGEVWVAIAPFAKHRGKIYDTGLMHRVVTSLLESRPELRVFLFGGGGDEARLLDSWAEEAPGRVVSLAGKKLGFARELSLLSWMDAVVTMDSANMHLASLVGAPTVSVWGATHPYCGFRAWKQTDEMTVQLPLTCRPCSIFGNKPCAEGDYPCMKTPPQIIIDKVLNIINKSK